MYLSNKLSILFLPIGILFGANSLVAKPAVNSYVGKEFRLHFNPRTPQQIQAFYEGRGFSPEALQSLSDKCFFTVGMKNTGTKVIWSDVSNWQFFVAGKKTRLFTRTDWKIHWTRLNVSLGHQATFRWTQFPIKLDFQPDEAEGGNVVVPRTQKPLSFQARFFIQEGKSQTPVDVKIENLKCAFD